MTNRRNFLKNAAMAGTGTMIMPRLNTASQTSDIKMNKRPKVLFFDVNETLLDLTEMKTSVTKALGGRSELLSLWFSQMLFYSSVETLSGMYHDFGKIGAAALQMVASNLGINLTEKEAKAAIIPHLRSIPPHPEVKEALQKLKDNGFNMVSLTNSSNIGVKTQFENAGMLDFFEQRLSIEDIGKYKPSRDAYEWAARKMKINLNECMLIAAHGWDIAGALASGWRAAFIKRPGKQLYPLALLPEMNENSLTEIADMLVKMD